MTLDHLIPHIFIEYLEQSAAITEIERERSFETESEREDLAGRIQA
jgi:hypothetical protein